eukprot:750435-Pleurochrysis_carterae.AAC.1
MHERNMFTTLCTSCSPFLLSTAASSAFTPCPSPLPPPPHSSDEACAFGVSRACVRSCNVNAADYDARTCLHLAASTGNLLIAMALIEHGANVNAKD